MSYAGLADRAGEFRALLVGRGVSRDRPLALLHGKTVEGYAAMLAALGLGVPYCCLDERNPPERQKLVLETLRPGLILAAGVDADAVSAARVAASGACPVVEAAEVRAMAPVPPSQDVVGTDVAYVMFTSGSTGRPKGVAISHANVGNFIDWSRSTFAISPGDVVANVNPMHFDNSVFDVYASLFNGASLAPVGRDDLDRAPAVLRVLEAAGCTVLFAVPSLLIYLRAMRALTTDRLPALRVVSFGGEGFAKPELRRLYEAFGHRAQLVNVYGPTECTCICSTHDVTSADVEDPAALAPLGPMAANFRGVVLDGDIAVADGDVGELCLIGPNVGAGYWNDPERTAEAFVANPLRPGLPERMYRTGDLVRLDPGTGEFHFVGRRDQQIKHMGHRIELGEIETVLNAVDRVRQAAVVYKRGDGPFGRILAVVSMPLPLAREAELLAALRERLPAYMMPHSIKVLSELPHNASGKIDRRRLAEELS